MLKRVVKMNETILVPGSGSALTQAVIFIINKGIGIMIRSEGQAQSESELMGEDLRYTSREAGNLLGKRCEQRGREEGKAGG